MMRQTVRPALARAAAFLLLKNDAVRLDDSRNPVLHLSLLEGNLAALDRLADLVINALVPLSPFGVEPVRSRDILLVHHIQNRMEPVPEAPVRRHVPLTWEKKNLDTRYGLAVIDDLPTSCLIAPPDEGPKQHTLTSWADILAVLNMEPDLGDKDLRAELNDALKSPCQRNGFGDCSAHAHAIATRNASQL